MILSYKQKRLLKKRLLERYPDAEIISTRSIKKSYTDTKVKATILEKGKSKETITYIDLKHIDGTGC